LAFGESVRWAASAATPPTGSWKAFKTYGHPVLIRRGGKERERERERE
jgi:hypothetical protein